MIEVKPDDYEVATTTNYTNKENKAWNFLVQSLLDNQVLFEKRPLHMGSRRFLRNNMLTKVLPTRFF
jgi:hypothetical protein